MLTIGTAQEASAQIASPALNVNGGNSGGGGATLERCSDVVLTAFPDRQFIDDVTWTIDGMSSPNGASVTIPGELEPGTHVLVYVVPRSDAREPDGSFSTVARGTFTFTLVGPAQAACPVFTITPDISVDQSNGGATLNACSTVAISNTDAPELDYLIEWSIDGMVQSYGDTLIIPADIELTPPSHTIGYKLATDTSTDLGSDNLFVTFGDAVVYDFTFANPSSLTECPSPDPDFTITPNLDVDQTSGGGGATLDLGSTVTLSDLPAPELAHLIQWSIDGVEQPDGATLTIPYILTLGAHSVTFEFAETVSIGVDGLLITGTTHTDTFAFTTVRAMNAVPDPDFTITPEVLGHGTGGIMLDPGSTVTITELDSPSLYTLIQWSLDGVRQPDGPTLTISDCVMAGTHEVEFEIPTRTGTAGDGTVTFDSSSRYAFDFMIETSHDPVCPVSEPVYTFDPLIFSNQENGGLTLEFDSTITVTGPTNSDVLDRIEWSIDRVSQPDGATLTIPTDLTVGEHVGQVIVIDTLIRADGEIFSTTVDIRNFKFTISSEPVYTFDPLISENQGLGGGGPSLEPSSTLTVTELTGSDLINLIKWTIDGVDQPDGATLTIPADITLGLHQGTIVAPLIISTASDGEITFVTCTPINFVPCTPMDFKFTIIPPAAYTFDPLILENQGPNAGGPTLESGDTLTITESTGSDLINQITWTINGVSQPDGATLTIPTGLADGIHRVIVVAPLTMSTEDTRNFEFTIGRPAPESQIGSAPAPDFTINPQVFHRDACSLRLASGNTITITELDLPSRYDLIKWNITGVPQPDGATLTIPTGLTNGEHEVKFEIPTRTGTDGGGMTTFESSSTYTFKITIGGLTQCTESRDAQERSSGGGNDWQKKPTFGKSYENTQFQVVENGFVFNGNSLNIIDNWHTEFLRTSSIIGDTNHVEIKVYTDKLLSSTTLQLGVPEIGKSSDAETSIYVMLDRNYVSPNDYDIVEIIHEQDEPLIDADETRVSIAPSHCTSDSVDMRCHTISFDFTIMAPLKYDVVAIKATDNDRRSTITFINEGVEFLGVSLLESATYDIHQKLGNQAPSETITLTQQDRRYQVWEDNNGYLWTQNEYGTFTQITHPDFVRYDDASSNVMTRINSAFDGMILDEQEKAVLIFDSMTIQGTLDDSFAHVYPTTDKRDNMEILLLDEEARILALLG